MKKNFGGFTLIELILVMAIIGVLAGVMVVSVNPARQLAKARDTQRETDIYSILSAVYQYSAEHSGALPDTDGNPLTSNFPASLTCIGTNAGCYNLAQAGDDEETMIPDYMAAMPKDPKTGSDGNTGYLIQINASKRLVASASGETKTITATR